MKKKDLENLKTKTLDELKKMADDLKSDMKKLHNEMMLGKAKNINELKYKKKDMARILTIMKGAQNG